MKTKIVPEPLKLIQGREVWKLKGRHVKPRLTVGFWSAARAAARKHAKRPGNVGDPFAYQRAMSRLVTGLVRPDELLAHNIGD